MKALNEATLIIPLIESAAGMESVRDILSMREFDAVWSGSGVQRVSDACAQEN